MSAKSIAAISQAQRLVITAAMCIGTGENGYPAAAQALEEAEKLLLAARNLLVLGPSKAQAKKQRATRITEDWQPNEKTWEWANANYQQLNLKRELQKMVNHFLQRTGDRGLSLDWNANFRNWLMKAEEINGGRQGFNGGHRRPPPEQADDRRSRLRRNLDERGNPEGEHRQDDDL